MSFVGLVLIAGCAQQPTKLIESKTPQFQLKTKLDEARTQIQSGTVILDTRPPLEFHANKVPGSILVEWKDFTLKNSGAEGVLDKDPVNITRRLALWGINQDSKVIVLGKRNDVDSEQAALFGRVAWMLREVGVKNVKTFNYELFKREVPGLNEAVPENKPLWMPIGEGKTEISFDEFQRMIYPFNYKFHFYTLKSKDEKEGLRVGRIKNAKIHFLDVRSDKEFHSESLKTWDETFPLTHIEWTQFYTNDGILNLLAKEKLEALGIHPSDMLVVISNHGVRSGAAVFALQELGYTEAKNFSGGYAYLKNAMTLEKEINAVFFEKEKKKSKKLKSKKRRKK